MRHILVILEQPGNQSSDNNKLALVAAENLAHFQEYRFDSFCTSIVVVSS
jgi:hypothetical protein